MKALQLASEQGQEILTITQENYSEAIKKISLSRDSMQDIRNAVNAGKEVTAHARSINFNGWTGSGYIILDTSNGTGAYIIDGGANGGLAYFIGLGIGWLISMFFLSPGLAVASFVATGFMMVLIGTMMVMLAGFIFYVSNKEDKTEYNCLLKGIAFGLVARGFPISKAKSIKLISQLIPPVLGIVIGQFLSQECKGF